MSKHDNGGPAFPVVAENGLGHVCDGMTLRDYGAIHGQLDPESWDFGDAKLVMGSEPPKERLERMHWLAEAEFRIRYMRADAMLRARGDAPAADPVRDAAPELLEALEAICEMQERYYGDGTGTHMELCLLAKAARDVIAKAKAGAA